MKNNILKLALNFSRLTGIPINKLIGLEKEYGIKESVSSD